jgi:hypothetical protein
MSSTSFETGGRPNHPAPVVVFAFKRPDHLKALIDSLLGNAEASRTSVRIYCDAPRNQNDAAGVAAVRRYASTIEGFASVTPVFRESNLGLARSIVAGVSEMLAEHDRVVVLEDDLILSPYFLRFMNEGLSLYATDDHVASIHGYLYPTALPMPQTFFLRGADCWGWATWRRAWQHFNPDGSALLEQLRAARLTHRFDFDDTFDFTQMLVDQIAGRNDSWAIRWHASCFLADRLTLYPGSSLVHNGGFDSSGRHCNATSQFDQSVSNHPIDVRPIATQESEVARQAIVEFFRSIREPWRTRLRSRMRRAIRTRFPALMPASSLVSKSGP